jgi:hypothetical protein
VGLKSLKSLNLTNVYPNNNKNNNNNNNKKNNKVKSKPLELRSWVKMILPSKFNVKLQKKIWEALAWLGLPKIFEGGGRVRDLGQGEGGL